MLNLRIIDGRSKLGSLDARIYSVSSYFQRDGR